MTEAGAGAVGDGLDREGLVVRVVEGELPGGVGRGLKGVGAQRDGAPSGEDVGVIMATVWKVASGRVRLRRASLWSA